MRTKSLPVGVAFAISLFCVHTLLAQDLVDEFIRPGSLRPELRSPGKPAASPTDFGVSPELTTVNFDDLAGSCWSTPFSPTRYPGVSFHGPTQNSLSLVRACGGSYSYPNHMWVGIPASNGAVNAVSPLHIDFGVKMKDVSLYVDLLGCNSMVVELRDAQGWWRTVPYSVSTQGWTRLDFNGQSRNITNLKLHYNCPVGQYQSPIILLDNVSFEHNPNQFPTGNFDAVSVQEGAAVGWAVDPDNTSANIYVDCYLSTSVFLGRTVANLPRAGLPYPGNHGFSLQIPSQYRNGNEYYVYCYALDMISGEAAAELPGSPRSFRFRSPIGWHDSVDADGVSHGWSLDPDIPSQSAIIHFYVDGPAGVGTYIGDILADIPRPDVNQQTGYPGNHGFRFSIPPQYRDGQNHTLYAYGLDLNGGLNTALSGNPKTFNLSPNVKSVTYSQIAPPTQHSVPIDANPLFDDDGGTDDGLRIFPDDDFPLDTADRSRIRVEADIGVTQANRLVYFRNFDMDDPSAHSEIDPDSVPDDNNGNVGGSKAGRLDVPAGSSGCQVRPQSLACPTNALGIASIDFTVTMQPGDNFAIAASTSEAEINSVVFDPTDGLHLLTGGGSRLEWVCDSSDRACRSRMITVWRRLHIETDAMPVVAGNYRTAKLVPGPVGSQTSVTIYPGETRVIQVFDTVSGSLEAGRFRPGRAYVRNNWLPISENTENTITVTNPLAYEVFFLAKDPIQLFDDDDFNNNDGTNLVGDIGESIPLPDRSFIPEGLPGDNRLTNILALAYIRPVYDVGSGLARLFKVNIDDFNETSLNEIIAFDNRMTPDYPGTDMDPQFWTVYLLNAYQGYTQFDGDGNLIYTSNGQTPRVEAIPSPTPLNEEPDVGYTTSFGLASLVYVEAGGPKECTITEPIYFCSMPAITAREVARALGAELGDGGLLDRQNNVLSKDSLVKIRRQVYP